MAIGFELLRLRHMPLDWVGHLVRVGSRIVTKLYKHMDPFQSARIVLGLKVSNNLYGDRWGGGLQFVPIGQDGFEVLSDGLAPSPAVVQNRHNQT